ncbi:arylesterase [Hydrogenovibrio halophilus]|uniref:arylesterase n=1 Tax=Hydrogenovibrio halophilus TaxID=373391 RepID=UPI000374C07A|nr:arylesterase [Hydrogenovibrio halophilus]
MGFSLWLAPAQGGAGRIKHRADIRTQRATSFWSVLWLSLGLLIISYSSVTQAQTKPKPAAAPATLLVFGDSLSAAYGLNTEQGWVALLAERLKQREDNVKVVNASLSGETTSGGKNRLPPLLDKHQPNWVILELGANDALRGQNLNATRANLISMVERSQQQGASVLLLGIRIPSNYGPAYDRMLRQTFETVSDRTGAALVPFFIKPVALKSRLMQNDRLHPNAEAQPKILDYLWPEIEKLLNDA